MSSYRDERLALFREVTGVDDDALALHALTQHNWDVQAAVQDFLNGGLLVGGDGGIELPPAGGGSGPSMSPIPQPVPPANSSRQADAPLLHRRSVSPAVDQGEQKGGGDDDDDGIGSSNNEREALLGGRAGSSGGGSSAAQQQAAGQPQAAAAGTLENIVTLPFKAVSLALRVVFFPLRLLTQPSGNDVLTPALAARAFFDTFQRDYGRRRHPPFLVGSFQGAVTQSIRESKFLVVYLHSPMHEDTPQYCRQTLMAETLVTFLEANVVVWGGSIQFSDAYGTAQLLEATSYPFLALLSCQHRSIEVLDRMEGNMGEEQVMQRITAAMARQQEVLERQEAARRAREERIRLQEEQNREYQEALESDRRREAARVAEAENKAREEEEDKRRKAEEEARAASAARQREEALRQKRQRLPPEPPLGQGGAMKLRLQFPTGMKVDRRFAPEDRLQVVRDYIDIYVADNQLEGPQHYSLSANFPKRSFEDMAMTLQQAALHSADTIYITDLDA